MADTINEEGAKYISTLTLNGTAYTIKDAWARAEIAEISHAVTGGTRFQGVSKTPIKDGDAVKAITIADGTETGTEIPAANQRNGDMFIFPSGTKNLEFIVVNGKYSEFGSTGELGALAFANKASGTATVDIAGAITLNPYTPMVSKGTMAVATETDTIEVTSAEDTANGSFSPAAITIPASTVTLTPTKGSFTALKDVTYNAETATLTITDGTSQEFWESATGEAAGQSVTPTADQPISVKYQKVTPVAGKTFLKSSSLTGDLTVTAAAPTATITNPTVTVTVEPKAD